MLRKIGSLLQNNAALIKIIAEAGKIADLNRIFKTIIGSDFAAHCQLLKIENNRIVVLIDKPTWARKFHDAIPDLLKDLRVQPEFKKIIGISYRVS